MVLLTSTQNGILLTSRSLIRKKLLESIPVKYDLKENMVELLASKEVRMVEVKKIKSLLWRDSLTHSTKLFINGNEYNEDGAPLMVCWKY